MSSLSIIIIALLVAGCVVLAILFMRKKKAFESLEIEAQKAEIEAQEDKSKAVAKSKEVLEGYWIEQLAAELPNFKYNPRDIRHLGEPIDYVVFNGLTRGDLNEIVFLEIKRTADTGLGKNERRIKDIVKQGNIKFDRYQYYTKEG